MRISIDSESVQTKSGTGKNGKPYSISTQTGYADTGKRYPAEVRIRVPDGQKSYTPGEYTIDFEKSTYVGAFDRLTLSEELVLVKLGEVESGTGKAEAVRAPAKAQAF